MINQYKRLDVFKCSQEAHNRFNGRVSVYHVLKEKSCYPQGCIYFLWHCVLLEKGNRCIKGYDYVGKNCKGCTYYTEDKIHLQPELLLNDTEYDKFQEELENFETWLDEVRFRKLPIAGRINNVKPWFERILLPRESHIKFRGYLLVFKKGFIGKKSFNDVFYIRVSENLMKINRFLPKMKIEMNGEIREDRGRIIVHKPKVIEIYNKGWGYPWTRERALVSVKTAAFLKEQPEQCLTCHWGALADVIDRRGKEENRYRNLYCLKGIDNPETCYVKISKLLRKIENKNKL
jgi:hypothetical protein